MEMRVEWKWEGGEEAVGMQMGLWLWAEKIDPRRRASGQRVVCSELWRGVKQQQPARRQPIHPDACALLPLSLSSCTATARTCGGAALRSQRNEKSETQTSGERSIGRGWTLANPTSGTIQWMALAPSPMEITHF